VSGGRRLIAIGAIVLAALVVLRVLGELTKDDQRAQGPAGSSYAYGPYGTSAYATLLQRSGHDVLRIRDDLRDLDLDSRFTVVVLWPDAITSEDAAALRRFVARGGRLVAADLDPGSWLGDVVPDPPQWADEPIGVTHPLAPLPETQGVSALAAGVEGVFTSAGSTAPALGNRSALLAVVARVGAGRAVLLADAAPLVNGRLARRDDAAFALAVAGAGRPVAFVESVHGYGRASGFGALPGRFRGALALLGIAGAALVLSRGRRLGPAQPEGRALAPARAVYADALAGVLVRSGPPGDAIAPVVAEARSLLRVPTGAGGEQQLAAARGAGLSEDEANAIVYGASSRAAALAAARGLARINERRGEA
jgi:Domain of unknown function (DUF4350)